MDFPAVIWQVVGHYAVASLADLELLSRAGLRSVLDHPLALAHAPLEFRTYQEAAAYISKKVLGGVRKLTLESTCSQALAHLAASAPNLQELDLGQCDNLRQLTALTCFRRLHTLQMRNCNHCTKFYRGLRELTMFQCSPIEGDLGNLQKLKLNGCVVNHISHMSPTLSSLDLHNTSWVDRLDKMTVWGYEGGWMPDQLHELESLQELKLAHCEFVTNAFARSIGHLKRLRSLTIHGCSLTDFAFIAELPNLQDLDVDHAFDWTVFRSASLRTLTLPCQDLSNLAMLKSQKELRMLRLRWHNAMFLLGPDLSAELGQLLPCVPNLHTLDLSYWGEMQGLPVCPSVRFLAVDGCTIWDHNFATLAKSFPNLHTLSMAYTNITNAGLKLVPLSVRHLRIRGCNITDSGVHALGKLPQLHGLDISGCDVVRVVLSKTVKLLALGNNLHLEQSHLLALRRRRVKIVNTEQFQTTLEHLTKSSF